MVVRRKQRDEILAEAQRLYEEGYDIHWITPPVVGDPAIRGNGKKLVYARRGRVGRLDWSELEGTYISGYNLGFRPGPTSVVGGGAIVVLDVDGDPPSGVLAGLIPGKPTTLSGSGSGCHYFIRIPPGGERVVGNGKRLWKGEGHSEILVIGSGGNVVLPPSRHWTGGRYTWGGGGIIDAGGELIEKLTDGAGGEDEGGEIEIGESISLRKVGPRSDLAKLIRNGVPKGERSEALFGIIAALSRKGFSPGDILATLVDGGNGISERYREGRSAGGAIEYARKDIARSLAKISEEKNSFQAILDELSEKYCHVLYGDATRVCYRERGAIHFMREGAFVSIKSHQAITVESGDKIVPAKAWLVAPDTPVFERVGFDPSAPAYRSGGGGMLNLWQGLAIVGKEGGGRCGLFKEHLMRNIAGGNSELYGWLWNWIAHLVQRPWEKPSTAVVLRGETGTGKTMVSDVICTLIGPAHSLSTSNPEVLTGKFNQILGDKIFVSGEELSYGGDIKVNAILKDRISARTVQIEPKNIDSFTAASYHRFMLMTNEGWPVNIMPRERRYSLFEVGLESQKDEKFFGALLRELGGGGYGRLMWELQGWEIRESWLRNPPVTDETREQQERSLRGVARWVGDCLRRGWFYRTGDMAGGWLVRVDPARMLGECRRGLGRHGEYVTEAEIRIELRRLFGGWDLRAGRIPHATRRAWKMPSNLDQARALFDQTMGSKGDW